MSQPTRLQGRSLAALAAAVMLVGAPSSAMAKTRTTTLNATLTVNQLCVATQVVKGMVLKVLCQPGNIIINIAPGQAKKSTSGGLLVDVAGVPTIVY